MKNEEYNIELSSKGGFITRLLLAMLLPIPLIAAAAWLDIAPVLGIDPRWLALIYPLGLYLTLHFTKSLSRGTALVTLYVDRLEIKQQMALRRKEVAFEAQFDDIDGYLIQHEPYFVLFRVVRRDGTKVTLNRDHQNADEFSEFIEDFESRIDVWNTKHKTELQIRQLEGTYGSKLAVPSAIVLVICMLLIPALLWFYQRSPNWGALAALYGGGIFYVYQVFIRYRARQQV